MVARARGSASRAPAPRQATSSRPRLTKYRACAIIIDGVRFASKREAQRWQELCQLQAAGRIADLRRQVRFVFPIKTDTGRNVAYIADFTYTQDGRFVVEDSKGFETDVSRLKRALMRYFHHIDVRLTGLRRPKDRP